MDVFTCGGGLLVPMLPSLYRLFGIASEKTSYDDDEDEDEPPQPTMLWSHKLRGFREGFAPGYVRSTNPLDGSLGRYVLGKLDFDTKRPLLSTRTNYQSVNIYEVANLVSKSRDVNLDGIRGDPDKILFLDGIIQSTLYGDAPYHESIVHPAMLVHPNPQRIAIIGGGEGATLREVLKHRSVTEVVIFEIDEELVNICREYMSEWSDCSDIDNGSSSASADVTSCFDDPRASVIYTDAFQWFVDRLSTNGNETSSWLESEKKFDVIIMDALDPKTSLEIAGGLYDDTSFVDSLFDALIEDGVFVVQMGKSRMLTDPHDEVGRFKQTGLMIKTLEQSGFESIHTYDEGHSHFYMPWSYLVALKDYETRAAWHRTAPEIQIELHQRLHRTKSGNPILRYVDVATMVGYQVPSRALEMVECREDMNGKVPMDCDDILGFYKQDRIHLPLDHIQVAKSGVGERAGRGLFAAQDIPEFATIGLEKSVQ
jgi:spermidine synthase